jgi:hypothetical protein
MTTTHRRPHRNGKQQARRPARIGAPPAGATDVGESRALALLQEALAGDGKAL